MIKSMTAFARSETGDALRSVVVEIRSYNSRHLDLVLRLTSAYAALEDKVKALVAAAVARGRVEVRLQIEAKTEEAVVFAVNAPAGRRLLSGAHGAQETGEHRRAGDARAAGRYGRHDQTRGR